MFGYKIFLYHVFIDILSILVWNCSLGKLMDVVYVCHNCFPWNVSSWNQLFNFHISILVIRKLIKHSSWLSCPISWLGQTGACWSSIKFVEPCQRLPRPLTFTASRTIFLSALFAPARVAYWENCLSHSVQFMTCIAPLKGTDCLFPEKFLVQPLCSSWTQSTVSCNSCWISASCWTFMSMKCGWKSNGICCEAAYWLLPWSSSTSASSFCRNGLLLK